MVRYQLKITKCREPVKCSICKKLINKGELHEAWYCGYCKEWANHLRCQKPRKEHNNV